MLNRRWAAAVPALLLAGSGLAADPPREHFAHATVAYDFVTNARGEKLRTFVTQPSPRKGKVPAVFFVGWLSCDSVEYAKGETDGFGAFLRRVIDQSGYATVRMDKPGVGESQGHCDKADFDSELTGYQAAFEAMLKLDFVDPKKVFVVGISNGGGVAPLVTRSKPVAGYVALGSWGRTWYEHMMEEERGRLMRANKLKPGAVNDGMRSLALFYTAYLMGGQTPGEVINMHPAWRLHEQPSLLEDITADGQYGRPAAFYQQLQSENLGRVWQDVTAPVLVIRGGDDTIMSRADSQAVADNVNATHPGHAKYVEVPGMSHLLTVNGKFHGPVVKTVLGWMKEQLH